MACQVSPVGMWTVSGHETWSACQADHHLSIEKVIAACISVAWISTRISSLANSVAWTAWTLTKVGSLVSRGAWTECNNEEWTLCLVLFQGAFQVAFIMVECNAACKAAYKVATRCSIRGS